MRCASMIQSQLDAIALPLIPPEPRLLVVRSNDGTAVADVENTSLHLKLRYARGRWWVEQFSWEDGVNAGSSAAKP
jgi:hypothetical protein